MSTVEAAMAAVTQYRQANYYDPTELHMSKPTIKALAKEAGIKKKPKGGWSAPGSMIFGIPIVVEEGIARGSIIPFPLPDCDRINYSVRPPNKH